VIPRSSVPFAPPAAGSPAPTPEELEQWKKTILDHLHFDATELDFGTVRRGMPAHVTLRYQLSLDEPLYARVLNNPRDLVVGGMQDGKLIPGESGAIDIELLTGERDGVVEQPLSLGVSYRRASVPFEFVIRGYVYSPLSAAPWFLRFENDEAEKEVVLRNNSHAEARITSIYSESSRFGVAPLPVAIGPGETLHIKVLLRSKPTSKNLRETLTLIFERPIEGMKNLSIPVLLNPEVPAQKGPAVLTPQDIEKLVPKKPPMPPL
jgi:hypothetical protein